MIKLGHLKANIDGDARYTDTLSVFYNEQGDVVLLEVTETGAASGMDGDGSSYAPRVSLTDEVQANPKAVMAAIKLMIANPRFNFKRYGKPSKNWKWEHHMHSGNLNAKACAAALESARHITRDE